MPRGVYKRKSKSAAPVAPAPSAPPVQSPQSEVRQPIVDMLAPGSEDDFRKSLTETPAPKKRKSKEPEAPIDPLMSDPLFKKQIERMAAFGVDGLVDLPCKASGQPLDSDERDDLKGTAYVISKKISGSGNPGFIYSWPMIGVYTFALVLRIIIARTDIQEKIDEFFKEIFKKPEPKETPTEETK